MQWDLGLQGLGVLALMSLAFGVIAQVLFWRLGNRWLWLIGGLVYFVAGIFISEVMFGWATAEELQPNIDGLSFDEVLLGGVLVGLVVLLATWLVSRRSPAHGSPMRP
ncbi:MAG TPA: hypothetical protein VF013_06935 [Candidatus Limnocylindria bacterium]